MKRLIYCVIAASFAIAANTGMAMGKKPQADPDSSSPPPSADSNKDATEQFNDYIKDSKQSTTPADVFIPGSTEPVRQDPPENSGGSSGGER